MFFQHNTSLRPPYQILIDTNFLSHTVHHKLPLLSTLMDTLYATCTPLITDCVMAELEKLGPKYRIALQIARDEKFERLKCDHKGTYADDCIVDRVVKSRVYLVATNDRDLKRRVRKVPGVPIVSVARGKYVIERLPVSYINAMIRRVCLLTIFNRTRLRNKEARYKYHMGIVMHLPAICRH